MENYIVFEVARDWSKLLDSGVINRSSLEGFIDKYSRSLRIDKKSDSIEIMYFVLEDYIENYILMNLPFKNKYGRIIV